MSIAVKATPTETRSRIAALADQCVKCGLCQPHCPTYAVARTEAESPRGRIALARALAQDALTGAALASAQRHLDQCLTCLRCEGLCPSQVRYGELILAARSAFSPRSDSGLRKLVAHPRVLRAALGLANLPGVRQSIQSRIFAGVWRRLGLERAVRELPRLPRMSVAAAPVAKPARGRVGVFLGCVASAVDRDVHAAAARLLAASGYEAVRIEGCCGALALHDGNIDGAQRLANHTRNAVAQAGVDTVLVSASGCFGTLRDAIAGARVREVHEFLAADDRFASLKFRALPARLALHTPCTQRSVARAGDAITWLLRQIPQVEIAALPDAPGCCGAAGDYFLHHGDIADTLRAQTLAPLDALRPDMLVTSNVGCRVFMSNATRVPVTHPVVLLARQLDN